jgi:hypothetical protein
LTGAIANNKKFRPNGVAISGEEMHQARNKTVARLIAGLVAAGFALRALIPVGYMPGSLADGQLFVLCPGSNPVIAEMLGGHAGSGEHHHLADSGNGNDSTSWEQCTFASACHAAPASHATVALDATPVNTSVAGPLPVFHLAPPVRPQQARAPPRTLRSYA